MRAKYRVDISKHQDGWKALLPDFQQENGTVYGLYSSSIPGVHEVVREFIAALEEIDPTKVNLVLRFVL